MKNLEKFWAVILVLVLLSMSVVGIFYLKSFRDRLNRKREKKKKWKVFKQKKHCFVQIPFLFLKIA